MWMDSNKGMLFYQCFTLTVRNVKIANPQRATGARGIATTSYQTRGDMEWLPGVGAAWKVADVEEGSTVAIFGLGGVGLAVAEGARLRGVAKIIGVDLNPDKFEIVGKRFGITDFVNPALCGEKKTSQVIKEMTEGGVDYSFECIGLTSSMEEAFNSTRTGAGKTVILGMEKQMLPISLGSHDLLRGRTICGTLFGGLKPKLDIPILVDSYLKKELNLDGFITHELSFEEINKAFDLLVKGKTIRCVLWIDK
ncbi:unnamed protein product [Eruca vesicaria subsp. sativa]|uniref:Alcohol dehydrogenase-like C-terminal domain-containing protein n=1 Tax=Eruca vesicaria subsp. sativa TaxID=29727 RepID=A0ABC8LH67_ERUVS|nr:unnamed protein product [Eruca vesicaria subsp. sativa]